jgi:endonuclease I
MRQLTFEEKQKNGCEYCGDSIRTTKKTHLCPYESCKYQELEEHETYTDYLEANDLNFYYVHKERSKDIEGEIIFGTN